MIKKYIYLLITGILFGSQFIITKFAIEGYSPLEVGMMRVVFGTLALMVLVSIFSRGHEKLKIKWYHYAIVAFFEGTLPCVLVPWGQQHVQTDIAAVIISTMPIFAMLFGPLFVKSEKLHWAGITSILASFIGVYILIDPHSRAGGFGAIIPELAILLASASWAFSLVLIKKLPQQCPFKLTRNILCAATIEIVPIWLIFGHPSQMQFSMVPLLSAIALGIFASGVVYVFYVLLIRVSGVNFAAFSNYLVPIVAGIIGIAFLHEKVALHEVIGFLIIVVGLSIQTIHDLKERKVKRKTRH